MVPCAMSNKQATSTLPRNLSSQKKIESTPYQLPTEHGTPPTYTPCIPRSSLRQSVFRRLMYNDNTVSRRYSHDAADQTFGDVSKYGESTSRDRSTEDVRDFLLAGQELRCPLPNKGYKISSRVSQIYYNRSVRLGKMSCPR